MSPEACCVPRPWEAHGSPLGCLPPQSVPPWGSSPHAHLPCEVEVRMVCQVDGCCLAGMSSVVDGKLPATEGIGHPDFQVTRVAFLTIRAKPEEADTIREDLGAPENLQGVCCWWDSHGQHSGCPLLLLQAGLSPGTKSTQEGCSETKVFFYHLSPSYS